jgi:hypothetical protein
MKRAARRNTATAQMNDGARCSKDKERQEKNLPSQQDLALVQKVFIIKISFRIFT